MPNFIRTFLKGFGFRVSGLRFEGPRNRIGGLVFRVLSSELRVCGLA
jgi:hypothetical protein